MGSLFFRCSTRPRLCLFAPGLDTGATMTLKVEPTEWAQAHFFVGGGNLRMQSAVASKIEEIAQRVAESEGMELVEVEVKGGGAHRFVRISIDKPEGVTHGDCELISQQVGTILDVENVVPGGRYTLEVSSPGIERKLVRLRDYERFQGKKAKIVLKEPMDQRRTFEGAIAGVAGNEIALELAPGQTVRLSFDRIQKANLKFEW